MSAHDQGANDPSAMAQGGPGMIDSPQKINHQGTPHKVFFSTITGIGYGLLLLENPIFRHA
jgi:hypothetical protein